MIYLDQNLWSDERNRLKIESIKSERSWEVKYTKSAPRNCLYVVMQLYTKSKNDDRHRV